MFVGKEGPIPRDLSIFTLSDHITKKRIREKGGNAYTISRVELYKINLINKYEGKN